MSAVFAQFMHIFVTGIDNIYYINVINYKRCIKYITDCLKIMYN